MLLVLETVVAAMHCLDAQAAVGDASDHNQLAYIAAALRSVEIVDSLHSGETDSAPHSVETHKTDHGIAGDAGDSHDSLEVDDMLHHEHYKEQSSPAH